MFEQWVGHRLLGEKVVRPHERAHRPVSISSEPVSEGIGIRQACLFVSSLIGALGKLLGGIGRFLLCTVGQAFSRPVILSVLGQFVEKWGVQQVQRRIFWTFL